jgi:sortase (surface protein transpeptidase)
MGLETGTIIALISVAASAAGSVVSYQQGQQAAKQSEYNAKAQADALNAEQKRKNAELAENQRRISLQSRRERATQLADLVGTGFVTTSGTPLAIMADTVEAQSRRSSDMATETQLGNWQMGTQGQSILAEGRSQASQLRGQAGASLISGLSSAAGSAYDMTKNRPKTATATR